MARFGKVVSAARAASAAASLARVVPLALAVALLAPSADAQSLSYRWGQNVSPAYEGWERGEDGTLYFLFGYFNRNWEEELHIPVGPANTFAPGPADRGQPTHFQPRRNRFTFRVPVPQGFTEEDELVWTLTANGVTEQAFASLRPDYFVDNVVIMSETGALGAGTSSPELRANEPPVIELETPTTLRARVGEPVRLVARITDDGVPRREGGDEEDEEDEEDEDEEEASAEGAEPADTLTAEGAEPADTLTAEQRMLRRAMNPPRRVTVNKSNGLHFAWFLYRGRNAVGFDPIQIKTWEDTRANANSPWAFNWVAPRPPADDRWVVEATFSEPGTYVLRGRADDGGLYADREITVVVEP